jgi:hypothetical protein
MVTRYKYSPIAGAAFSLCGVLLIAGIALVSCAPQQPDPQAQINAAVAATLSSIPTATPYPSPTPVPSATLFSLDGMFCEYGFCIGHPADVYLIDEGATHNPPAPSATTSCVLFGYNLSLFMELAWRVSDPNYDPQAAMKTVMEENQAFQGNLDAMLMGKLNIYYQSTTTGTDKLPFGAVATWQCGGRDFMWKVYTPQDGMAQGLLKQALERFRCKG